VFATVFSQQVDDDRVESSDEVTDAVVDVGESTTPTTDGAEKQQRPRQRQRNTMFVGNLSFGE
jgi:hypothetical protein